MNPAVLSSESQEEHPSGISEKRVILSMGGKGGVGKTSVMTGLAEWFGVDAESLAAYNGYTLEDVIQPGDVLVIPQ